MQKRNDTLVSGCIVPKEEEENGEMNAAEPLNDEPAALNDETNNETNE